MCVCRLLLTELDKIVLVVIYTMYSLDIPKILAAKFAGLDIKKEALLHRNYFRDLPITKSISQRLNRMHFI